MLLNDRPLPSPGQNVAVEMLMCGQLLSLQAQTGKKALIWVFHNFIPTKAYRERLWELPV